MRVVEIDDIERIDGFLRRDEGRHLYAIGDLDPFFFPRTRWWAAESDSGALEAMVLRYDGADVPTILAFGADLVPLRNLMRELLPVLPDRAYMHLESGAVEVVESAFTLDPHGAHHRMMLTDPEIVRSEHDPSVEWLGPADLDEVLAFYAASYPGNWFDPRMLETGRYVAVRESGRLASVAGVHVWSAERRIAALGNIATHPDLRCRGYGGRTSAALCRRLLDDGCTIGLNVAADNQRAISLYTFLGFSYWSTFDEFSAVRFL